MLRSSRSIGRMFGEHEATVSRHLARIRRTIREFVEDRLRVTHGFDDRSIEECFHAVIEDPGAMDIATMFADLGQGKNLVSDRSEN